LPDPRPPICDYEGSDYQQTFWEHGGRSYEDAVEAVALGRLVPGSGRRVLDLGAGAGRNAPRYAGFEQRVLLDYSRTMLEQAQARIGTSDRVLYVAADAYRLPFAPALFDCVVMVRVLHHMAEPQAALRQVARVLAGQATFVLEFANKRNLKAIGRWVLRRQAWNPFTPEPIEFLPLHFDFHPAAVRDWLTGLGLTVERTLTVSHFRSGALKRAVPGSWLVRLDAGLQRTGGLWQLSPSVFVQARAPAARSSAAEGAFWACPNCRSFDLTRGSLGWECARCGAVWEVRGGIHDFRRPFSGPRPATL
jgi:SAM-dependent methyltransferase